MSVDPIEALAIALSVAAVWLTTARNILCWPLGLVSVMLYGWIFARAHLYSDALLQIFYAGLLIYGWWQWRRQPRDEPQPAVRPARPKDLWFPLGLAVLGAGLLGTVMSFTDAALPWLDATLTALSLVAQYWTARMMRENWLMWIGVDVVYVGVYWSRGLPPTSLLYAGFVAMAAWGWWRWRGTAEPVSLPSP